MFSPEQIFGIIMASLLLGVWAWVKNYRATSGELIERDGALRIELASDLEQVQSMIMNLEVVVLTATGNLGRTIRDESFMEQGDDALESDVVFNVPKISAMDLLFIEGWESQCREGKLDPASGMLRLFERHKTPELYYLAAIRVNYVLYSGLALTGTDMKSDVLDVEVSLHCTWAMTNSPTVTHKKRRKTYGTNLAAA